MKTETMIYLQITMEKRRQILFPRCSYIYCNNISKAISPNPKLFRYIPRLSQQSVLIQLVINKASDTI